MQKLNKPALNNDQVQLTDTEIKLLFTLRHMKLFDKLEIKYAKQGEIMWQLIETHRGTYDFSAE